MGSAPSTTEVSAVQDIDLIPTVDTDIVEWRLQFPIEYRLPVNIPRLGWLHPLRVEDTYWDEKRKVMPSRKYVKVLDDYAVKAPATLPDDIFSLVRYLTVISKDDFEKHRIIFKWLCSHVKCTTDDIIDDGPEETLKRRETNCMGFARLHARLCSHADLGCEVVCGLAREGQDINHVFTPPYSYNELHAWTKIRINGKWFLCDAIRASSKTCRHGHDLLDDPTGKRWMDCYFLCDPRAFSSTHLPLCNNGNQVNIEDQFLDSPFERVVDWNREAVKGPNYFTYGIEAMDHNGIVYAKNNEVVVKFKMRYVADLDCILELLSTKDTLVSFLADYTFIYFDEQVAHVKVRLPRKGDFLLRVKIHPFYKLAEKELVVQTTLLSYVIRARDEVYPGGFKDPYAGPMEDFYKFGLILLDPTSTLLKADSSGRCRIVLKYMKEELEFSTEMLEWYPKVLCLKATMRAKVTSNNGKVICDVRVSTPGVYSLYLYGCPVVGEFVSQYHLATWVIDNRWGLY
ncbi:uncharacterized protein LOC144453169 [Glandiceps talaboti]